MKVALIGSGGREHAIAYKLIDSDQLEKLYILPGNAGTARLGENVNLDINDNSSVLQFCKNRNIKLVVIGPEKPLVNGLSDLLRNNSIKVFGPSSTAARIESEKSYAKKLMKKYNIPTADFVEYSSDEYSNAIGYLKSTTYPKVIKANGLAAGKGVIICNSKEEAEKTLIDIFKNKIFGKSGDKIVIEEFLVGDEASIFAITDGEKFETLPSAQDHKRIGDNDTGKNTGGMGSYSPAPIITPKILGEVEEKIISPILCTLSKENNKFIGCLYCGLILTKDGPKVIEFNCRFGDPETQSVLPLLEGDFLELLYSAASGSLNAKSIKYSGGSSVCVIAASKGYPDSYKTGYRITGFEKINDPEIVIFHSGTKFKGNILLTNGGRVLGVTSIISENNITEARNKAYNAIKKIQFTDIYFRRDIASKAIEAK
ncbi:MAG: phosphoribosylamine--glycine ligase [Ignavibacteria bacterium RIFOXYB2_FULL_35_12]|nr:MAG: phosphoribosylamine--glycine ligase [Ignavibacteria bacterium GWF2_35_20]OGU88218.1 MAG: phosphoribosylamine--glycine ligase [Ignavibacteria bacterium RIFOXYA12_FULL_35_25]OGU92708.1 MAG: phosphoribosylamine--glycine ligase [Ignavibacteria bacterium RIFOXYC12_FULL_35_11]OGU98019.1 MAG: phosphoribosylamine--glycine ligase [Ignavibacteria bacterium RIFOXYB12_FULL_35_14]OGV01384.1 MAG: phosphoribosylamine--glycine ligase [Ignavibacteria bacterium RIFOXYC2_FULL_35_16]OGV04264.1 MAG: phosph